MFANLLPLCGPYIGIYTLIHAKQEGGGAPYIQLPVGIENAVEMRVGGKSTRNLCKGDLRLDI